MSDTLVMNPAGPEQAPHVALTPNALNQVRFLIQKQRRGSLCLRIAVKGGGCSGLSYVMNLEEAPTERDFVIQADDVRVIVDRKSARFIDGLRLDYSVKNLLEGGWQYENPNAQRSCGCGTSFTPRD